MKLFDNAHQARVISHEEKAEHMARFIGYYLDRMSVRDDPGPAERAITLLARSPRSPCAMSIIASLHELVELGAQVRAVFCKLEPAEQMADWVDLAAGRPDAPAFVTLRWARNTALLEAHEQLVLGSHMSWAGDCMRREPEKRDAYELFSTFNADAARRLSQSYEALWAASEPIRPARQRAASLRIGEEQSAAAAAADPVDLVGDAPIPFVSTRH